MSIESGPLHTKESVPAKAFNQALIRRLRYGLAVAAGSGLALLVAAGIDLPSAKAGTESTHLAPSKMKVETSLKREKGKEGRIVVEARGVQGYDKPHDGAWVTLERTGEAPRIVKFEMPTDLMRDVYIAGNFHPTKESGKHKVNIEPSVLYRLSVRSGSIKSPELGKTLAATTFMTPNFNDLTGDEVTRKISEYPQCGDTLGRFSKFETVWVKLEEGVKSGAKIWHSYSHGFKDQCDNR